jgi:putative nucleotidyltransferase with HDIG domain
MRTPTVVTSESSAAHSHRVAQLSARLQTCAYSASGLAELCNFIDEAAEFAALEGNTIADAVATVIEERWPAAGLAGLATLVGYGSANIDVSASTLPVVPRQVFRLLATSNDATSPLELEDIATSDPVLAGRLLGAANSVRSESAFEITRLLEAIKRLGIPETRKVLLGACFAGIFASGPLQNLWKHSEAVARTAHDLAQFAGLDTEIDTETAYVAGLLHDIGRLRFVTLPAASGIRERDWLAAGFPLAYAETLAFGIDHAAIGANCLHTWGLPDSIVEAVRLHHRPEAITLPLAALLNLAEDLTARSAGSASEDLWPDMRRTAACGRAGISLDQLEEFSLRNSPFRRACG